MIFIFAQNIAKCDFLEQSEKKNAGSDNFFVSLSHPITVRTNRGEPGGFFHFFWIGHPGFF